MPQLGETVAEGKILAWFKSVGDEVKEGDNLFEVETDKVTLEVQSVVAGRLDEIRVGAGVVGEGRRRRRRGWRRRRPSRVEAGRSAGQSRRRRARRSRRSSTPLERFGPAKAPDGVRATPLARRLIAQNGLDIGALAAEARATGRATESTRRRVRAALAARAAAPQLAPAAARAPRRPPRPLADGEVVTLNAMRLRTGERLAENWRTIPHVFQAIEVDFTALDRVRRERKEAFRKRAGLLADLSAVHRARDLPRHRGVSADQRALRRQEPDRCRATSISASPSISRTTASSFPSCATPAISRWSASPRR